jgi:UPF0716 protein FxsA
VFPRLLLLFTVVPILELWLLIKVGSHIGAAPTIALVLVTGIAGAALARQQGFATMLRIRESMAQGLMPAEEMLDGVLILAAGVMLITPGLITDSAGLLLLVPPARNAFKRWLRRRFDEAIRKGSVTVHYRNF